MTTDTDISYLAIHETDNLLLVCFRNMDSIFGILVKLSVGGSGTRLFSRRLWGWIPGDFF